MPGIDAIASCRDSVIHMTTPAKPITLPTDEQLEARLVLAQQIADSAFRIAGVVLDELARIRTQRSLSR